VVKGFAGFMLIFTLILTSIIYFLRGGIIAMGGAMGRSFSIDRKVKAHLGILAGLFIINIGFGFYLDTFRLLFSEHAVIFGAGYTDIHAKLFFYRILIVITPIAGILFMAAALKRSMRLALIPPAIVFTLYFIGVVIYPSTVQKFKVAPNELALETPTLGTT